MSDVLAPPAPSSPVLADDPAPVLANTTTDLVPADLRASLAANNIIPLWEAEDALLRGGPTEPPRIWRWSMLRPLIERASLIAHPSIVERRVLQLANPDLRSSFNASSGLINATVQSTRPGEVARPHRHTMNALRFGLEGSTGETMVDGKVCRMGPGDLIVTPAWTWHGHRNDGDEHTIWLDILDVALHVSLGAAKFQPGPAGDTFPTFADAMFQSPGVVPASAEAGALPHSPLYRYPWSSVRAAFDAMPAAEDGSKTVRYVNPVSGGSILTFIDCYAIELAEGQETVPLRSSAHAVCSVVEGRGSARVVGRFDSSFDFRPKDLFNVPQHSAVSYRAEGGPARLFLATNRELFRRLDLLVEDRGAVS